MKFCSNCGKDNDGMRFCSGCGINVSENQDIIDEVRNELPPYENKFGSIMKKTIIIEDEVLSINKMKLRLYDINVVYHISPRTLTLGYIYFSTSGQPPKNANDINHRGFHYSMSEYEKAEELLEIIYMVDHIEVNLDYTSVQDMLKSHTQHAHVATVDKERSYLSKSFKCPRCKSANIQLMDTDTNIKKVKNSTSLNLNPLKPFTVFNHNEKKKKKRSKGKLTAAVLTGGASLLVTGTKDNKGNEYHCADCGKVWRTK